MEVLTRDRVPALTGLLTAISLALVFGAVLGAIPAGVLPRAPAWVYDAIPHANAAISFVAILTIVQGWRWIRQGQILKHRAAMLTALGLFALFLLLYLYRIASVGTTSFAGPETVKLYLYYPFLAVHMVFAIVCIPLLYYVVLTAVTRPINEIPKSNHKRVGRVAAALWLVSFSMGIGVYLLLYIIF
ncbi:MULTISPECIES: DUF420 domain-containing protein [unclassified Haladaptatus]|uniref:DUF420 domain-containing protein n=1 Tax=unclassified Haladaptatus TaxID=2622732 RepID=UPI0023E7EABE|nr:MULTISPECIES: DUF420 domain-containing protein [unclassified Haladaptatus]